MTSFLKPFPLVIISVCAAVAFYLLIGKKDPDHGAKTLYRIGITQIAPHPSLDKIAQGVQDALEQKFPGQIKFYKQNALGNMTTAAQIAKKFTSQNLDAIVSITTPSTLMVYDQAKKANIPVIFSGVTDPYSVKLIKKGDPPPNIGGVIDTPPVTKQAELIGHFIETGQTIGILYNAGEPNSKTQVDLMIPLLEKIGYQIKIVTVDNTKEISPRVLSIIADVSALYFPNDNMIASSLDTVIAISDKYHLPVFSSDPESVERGALATIAPDQYAMGLQTGEMVTRSLNKQDLSVETVKRNIFALNLKKAEKLGIRIPQSLLQKADTIIR